ncbi:MAG: hypothetical protein ACUVUF_01955 [Candidatus Bathycorpusculaceae bacterium]
MVEPPVITLGMNLAVGDVDDDGKNEIILGVIFYIIFWSKAHIRVFAWEDETLIVEGSKDWEDVSYVQSIAINYVDNDGKTEIITAGYSAGLMVIPTSELAIWSVSKVASSLTLTLSSHAIVISESVTISGTLTDETGDTRYRTPKLYWNIPLNRHQHLPISQQLELTKMENTHLHGNRRDQATI